MSNALARIAECEVTPPTSVMIPTTFSFTIAAVIDGVKSRATSIVPAGTLLISTS